MTFPDASAPTNIEIEQSDDHEETPPESTVADDVSPAETPCQHLNPSEAAEAIRRHNIDAALNTIVTSFSQPRSQETEPEELHSFELTDIVSADWLWPSVAATTATFLFLLTMKIVPLFF